MRKKYEGSTRSEITKALVYCRVSTVKQTVVGTGLQTQEQRCRAYCRDKGYEVEAVFPDDASGGGDFMARPGMVALLSFLDANPHTNYVVVFDDLKRFARDTIFHFNLRQALAMRKATVECLNFRFDDTPEGEFVETVFAAQGQLERKQNARQTLQKMKARTAAGYYCRNKVWGYRYKKIPGNGKMLVPDGARATVIREAIEGFASGRFETPAEVARFLKAQPCMPSGITRQRATDVLRRSLYAGYITLPSWGFHMHPAKHKPLISLATWQKVQDKLDGKKKRPARSDINELFPLRNFVACECCGRAMTGGQSKGRNRKYAYYVCQTKGCDYRNKSIRTEVVESAFSSLIRTIRPAPELINAAKDMFARIWDNRAAMAEHRQAEMNAALADLEAEKSKMIKRLVATNNASVIAAYEEEIEKMDRKKSVLTARQSARLEPQNPFDESFKMAMNFLSNAWILWEKGDFMQKRFLLRLVVPEPIRFCREKGFLNPDLALPFKTLQALNIQNENMVRTAGLEPACSKSDRF
uniref:Uncharacterized protein n=1 Tax=Aquisalinus luteolus TaxID=1566827 RepID=A0A8J3AA31_9PROT|nr:hypothetical protein GCM10011355_34850 [Aquisalinus luteolus]